MPRIGLLLVFASCLVTPAAAQDITAKEIDAQMEAASAAIEQVMERATQFVTAGKCAEANDAILAVFPESTRTPVQCLVLGNVLFEMDHGRSYTLHQAAARALPGSADALLEWAMEQHRAKEYVAAAATYDAYLTLSSDYAPAHGLLAECKLRAGDVDGAVRSWDASEQARRGTLETFESLVCAVNGTATSHAERCALLQKATTGDLAAVASLLLLDAEWRSDWWNCGLNTGLLEHDLAIVKRIPNPDARLRAALCAAECLLDAQGDNPDPRPFLEKYALLIDKDQTLPEDGRPLSILVHVALDAKVLGAEDARERLGPRILDIAARNKDPEAFNLAAYLNIETERLPEIDQAAWDATHDPRFASSLLHWLWREGTLTLDDPRLVRALKEFPESAEVQVVVVEIAREAKAPMQDYLVGAIKAEYTHFISYSPNGIDMVRPRASMLRRYFRELAQLRAQAPNAMPAAPGS